MFARSPLSGPAWGSLRASPRSPTTSSTPRRRGALAGDPLSFLHVSRAEIDLPPDTDPVRRRGLRAGGARTSRRLQARRRSRSRTQPAVYLYRLTMGGHEQTGVAGRFSVDEYQPRPDQEAREDAARQGGRPHAAHHRDARAERAGAADLPRATRRSTPPSRHGLAAAPLYDFTAADGIGTRSGGPSRRSARRSSRRSREVPALYIADGHHRAASAARAPTSGVEAAAASRGGRSSPSRSPTPDADPAVPPRREGSRAAARRTAFLAERRRALCRCGPAAPTPCAGKGECAMYLGRRALARWRLRRLDAGPAIADPVAGARRAAAAGPRARAAARHRRPAHRQAHRLRRRHPRHRPSWSGWSTAARRRWPSRCTRRPSTI